MRKVPASGVNLFQSIYALLKEYKEKTGREPLNLSLGNPDTVPPEALLKLQARFAADPAFAFHTYAEDGNLLRFAEGMVELHGGIRVQDHPELKAAPIAGIKTATAFLPLACGLHLPDSRRRDAFCVASNLPAYDVIGAWAESYLGARRVVWPLRAEDRMRLNVKRLREAARESGASRVDLIHVIRPGNPAAVGASEEEWRDLMDFCAESRARLVCDGAYAGLAKAAAHVPLAKAAAGRTDLEWMEMYSVSKSFSDPGARLGALVGSREFVDDFLLVKGNADSGPVPYIMAAYGTFLEDQAAARRTLDRIRELYERRLNYVVERLRGAGLREACPASAGFFTLWKAPRRALGTDLARDTRFAGMTRSEAFNRLTASETGIVGVHFEGPDEGDGGEPLIRYAVCADVLSPSFQRRFEEGLARLNPEY
jgi:aspartate/methionine/tyrosine aminotransferase